MSKVLIIAEAGVNHNGDIGLAKQLIDAAADAGADYVKFQTFNASRLVTAAAAQADYQTENTGKKESQLDMLKRLELSESDHKELIAYCKSRNIRFLSTAFDNESVDLLSSLGMDLFKIPSGEITNLPYIEKIGYQRKKVIVSTGMCVMQEIEAAVKVLEESGTDKKDITILHCTTDYPTKMEDVNLLAMLSIAEKLKLPIGYSDHTNGIEVAIAAVAMGATIIEKHFTISRELPGPDHKASLEPSELKEMVKAIRNIEKAMGSAEKKPTEAELRNMKVARKSIHLSANTKAGTVLTSECLVMKRPGDGISPMLRNEVIGRRIKADLPSDHKLSWEDLE
jgi:N-acetylneuraminate synthase